MAEFRPSTPELYDLPPCGREETPGEALRVLVQTRTHLVPGAGYYDKLQFMLNLICEHVWGRIFIPRRDRFHLYGPPLGAKNHRFYFVVDHGRTLDDSTVPVRWYQFTGKEDPLKLMPHALPESFQKELRECPFTRRPREDPCKPEETSEKERRKQIRFDLCDEKPLREWQVNFLMEHPEHAEWIKTRVEPRFWARAETKLQARREKDQEPEQALEALHESEKAEKPLQREIDVS